tara:strand:+ start:2142 stop:2834 length:693 start_codon:yes stop_codon:yes gene_type:complete
MMKAYYLPFFILVTYHFSASLNLDKSSLFADNQKDVIVGLGKQKSYFFPDALIYEYEVNGEKEELWIYVNQKTRQLLFVPNDDMISGVISFPNGTYKIFVKTESGKDSILTQKLPEITEEHLEWEGLKTLDSIRTISQQNIQQNDITSFGYQIEYLQMSGSEVIYVTQEIPINSHQLYGFCKLDGDARLKIPLDFSAILSNSQVITHIERSDSSLKLLNYGPNPYYFTFN